MSSDSTHDLAFAAKAWPFEEARKLIARMKGKKPTKGHLLFETGYGPSGLPHIGTFGEVARTTMVRRAFEAMSDVPTKLIAFSDDMDGLRKVPGNVPNQELLAQHLGKPLTQVPDPFGTHESFGHHNNARLRAFLDEFGFEYEFMSASAMYLSGAFDTALLDVLRHYDAVIAHVLPTLGADRRQTYSPFLPVCAKTGRVLMVPVVETKVDAGTIVYRDEDGSLVETPVTGGKCKLQWKADWAMRWHALGVDYEMSGKDLIPSVELSTKICRSLGSAPPETFSYELFLDENGEKISKSRGNGLTMEDWLRYASPESLALYMFQQPKRAKRLYFDVIPKAVDEYFTYLEKFPSEDLAARLNNPVWHIHHGQPPHEGVPISFTMLLNLVSAANVETPEALWGFIARYVPGASAASAPQLDLLVQNAISYFHDLVKPTKRVRSPNDLERAALVDLRARLAATDARDAETLQTIVYDVGKAHPFDNLRDWFKAIYEVLLGSSEGPRMGSFIALYGRPETIALIDRELNRAPNPAT
jgi:lysyl-tRNA synthetase class 1